ncbi:chaperone protein ClpD, chloroplastic isoform X2 [Manihot esculenta]|uniref:chaperone protein ClpD, chloroplastic isoform X2 n=1 Tax=Manihot esculenta TaxID=3983 RepID=UPI001CC49660|nr:chaperone protein ClpD, chloroplastic isoform X2 [Manihot esculenta]
MEVLSSSPLSVHSRWDLGPLQPSRSQRLDPLLTFSSSNNSTISSSLSFCSGISISHRHRPHNPLSFKCSRSRRKRRILPISAVFERFTERAIKVVIFSQREARALGKDMVFTQHLLLGLIGEDRDPNGLLGSGLKIDKAREVVRDIWSSDADDDDANASVSSTQRDGGAGATSSTDVPFSISTKRVFEAAVEYSRTMGHNFISPEHIAVGLFTVDDGSATRVLKRLGANVDYLAAEAVTRLQGELAKDGRELSVGSKRSREKSFYKKAAASRSSEKTREKSALDQFCLDLTARASEGLLDPVIGRETEIERIIEILCRRTKNNPILLGESGVGKTAIAEGLAISIAQANVPVFLLAKRVMSLDMGLLIAGAKERGELEARVTALIREILKEGNIILFIDEVHTLVGTGTVGRGNKGSGLDIANLLKPSLGRGELQCIASTTIDEYRMHFESDKALARRFQPVSINEPNQEDAVKILMGLRQKYEAHHNCIFTPEAIYAAVHLSARYIADRYLPDKAIDLLDEAGSRAHIDAYRKKKEQQTCILSKSPDDYWQEIRTVQAMHEVVLASKIKDYDIASSTKDSGEIILEAPVPVTSDADEPTIVGPDDIAAVASLWSGIPVQQLTADERMFLLSLDDQLRERVIGQDEAVAAISRAVKRSRVGLKDPDRPIAAMMFCGPTGVGKTELAKALAACYFGSESAMLRLDMSEYMERHTVSKLIGSPPGYVGYGEGGTLTEAIRRQPFSLVLLDEIEKAHPDVFNILLQLFEDGHLTDSQVCNNYSTFGMSNNINKIEDIQF